MTPSEAADAAPRDEHPQSHFSSLARDVKAQGIAAVDDAKRTATSAMEERKGDAAAFIHDVADALEAGGDRMRGKGRPATAGYIGEVARGLDDLAGTLERQDLSELSHKVQDFSRKHPAIVIGAAFVAGLGLMRFMKSSSSEQSGEEPYGRAAAGTSTTGVQGA